jgi:hypothetical protein
MHWSKLSTEAREAVISSELADLVAIVLIMAVVSAAFLLL